MYLVVIKGSFIKLLSTFKFHLNVPAYDAMCSIRPKVHSCAFQIQNNITILAPNDTAPPWYPWGRKPGGPLIEFVPNTTKGVKFLT
jgi:hypothetical protein